MRARHWSELQWLGFGKRGQGKEVAKGETIKEGPYTAEMAHGGGEGKNKSHWICKIRSNYENLTRQSLKDLI